MTAPTVTLWHNPRCSKSRRAHELLDEADVNLRVVHYLDEPPTRDELTAVLSKLQMRPSELVRSKEATFVELGLSRDDDEAVLAAMLTHPILIERPIAIVGERAVVGRPPEKVLALLES
jgi:arsenate reductase